MDVVFAVPTCSPGELDLDLVGDRDRVDDLALFALAAWRTFVAACIVAFMPARLRSLVLSVVSGSAAG